MNFTERAGFAIKRAQEIASSRGRTEIAPDDIVAGLAAEKMGIAARALAQVGATLTRIRQAMREIDEQDGRTAAQGTWSTGEVKFDPFSEQCLERAVKEAQKRRAQFVGTEHILLGVLGDPRNRSTSRLFHQLNLNPDALRKQVEVSMNDSPRAALAGGANQTKHPTMDTYCVNLNEKALAGKLDPLVGRVKELKNVEIILGRRTKRNPILIGEAGVGKTAIAEGLAQRIVAGEVKENLRDAVVYQVDLGAMVAGTKYRGEFEERFKALLNEVKAYPQAILVFDEVHNLVGGGSAEGSMDAANLLKPAIARGEVRCIGATTLNEYRKHIEPDRALLRRFQEVMVGEPTVAETVEILRGLKELYEKFHKVKISEVAIVAAAEMSSRYIQDRLLPDKAIDLIDEAGSAMSGGVLRRGDNTEAQTDVETDLLDSEDWPEMTEVEIAEVVENHTGIALSKLTQTGKQKLLNMPLVLSKRVVGQEEAINAVTAAMQTSGAGLKDPSRPIASLIFCGPTGVGKTELTKALAEYFFDDEEAMIRLDMSEYMEKHSVSKLVGSPPGYVGFNEGGQLTEAIRRKPYSVVLFDEIEKAHPDVFNIMLQVLDDGRLTDSQGRVVDFKNSIIIMTSNAGSKVIMDGGGSKSGFDLGGSHKEKEAEESYNKIKELVTQELRQLFRPEFLNRVDKVVVFRSLKKEELRLIIDILMIKFGSRLVQHNLTLELSPAAREHILTEGFEPTLGARPIRRAIQNLIDAELARLILGDKFKPGDHLIADINEKGETTFSVAQPA